MEIYIFDSKKQLGEAAAQKATELLKSAISTNQKAVFVAATGISQFDFLEALVKENPSLTQPLPSGERRKVRGQDSIDWSKTVMFHLDEYIGLPEQHPASFRKYLKERLINKVQPGAVHLIQGDGANPQSECARLNKLIAQEQVAVSFAGIGQNGHLAFNDPPADFDTEAPYIVVELDETCRRQQLGEGWFKSLEEVPKKAISMSIRQIMKSRAIICIVPGKRKAMVVKNCLEKEISNLVPASILRNHPNAYLYLDKDSASLLNR